MAKRTTLSCLVIALALLIVGCGDSTEVSKDANDAYHRREAGGKPPAGAMQKAMNMPRVGPYAKGGGAPAGGPPPGAGAPPAAGKGG
jgi:hypothetical protein